MTYEPFHMVSGVYNQERYLKMVLATGVFSSLHLFLIGITFY